MPSSKQVHPKNRNERGLMSTLDRIKPRDLEPEPPGYGEWLIEVKARVRNTQLRIIRSANADAVNLYWSIGRDVIERQQRLGWGSKVVPRLSEDLKQEFPKQRGWSTTNLNYMLSLARRVPLEPIFQQVVGKLPWGHIVRLLDKTDDLDSFVWYAAKTIETGWSRDVMAFQIQTDLRARVGAAASNFAKALPPGDSELAQQMTKDPYIFELAGLTEPLAEKEFEQALINRLEDTLMELGRGFTFVGRQVRVTVGDYDQYADLLMFHTEQLRYVVVELKVGPFEPGYLGQLATYVKSVDAKVRNPDLHEPTVGLLLCTGRTGDIATMALSGISAPVAVAEWQGVDDETRAALPSPAELEAVIQDEAVNQMRLHGLGSAETTGHDGDQASEDERQ
jgi:predicted nuclease of restriction endonuclease-like (RecB) superfamily